MKNGVAKEWAESFYAGFPTKVPELENTVKNSTVLNEKLAEAAFVAAEDSIKLSAEWTKEALVDLEQVTKAQSEPANVASTLVKYTAEATSKSTQRMTALAEIMGRMQAETIRLFVEASKDAMHTKAETPVQKPETAKPRVKKVAATTAN